MIDIDKIIDDYVGGVSEDPWFMCNVYSRIDSDSVCFIHIHLEDPGSSDPTPSKLAICSVDQIRQVVEKEVSDPTISEAIVAVFYGSLFRMSSLDNARTKAEEAAKQVCRELSGINKVSRCEVGL